MAKTNSTFSYVDKIHSALSASLDGFNKSPDEFKEAIKDPEYAKRVHNALSQTVSGFTQPIEGFTKSIGTTLAKKDNTNYYNPISPLNIPLEISKKAVSSNQLVQEKDKYFNPEYRPDITTGNKEIDFLYRNQYLMDLPIIGDIIKKKAYGIARQTAGEPTLSNEQLKEINANRGYMYNGNDEIQIGQGDIKGASLLDQYFSKDKLLPIAKYRPTSDYMRFLPIYSIKGDEKNGRGDDYYKKNFTEALNLTLSEKFKKKSEEVYNKFLKDKKPVYMNGDTSDGMTNLLGRNLAGHKAGLGWDEERNLPYISVSDAWDFEPSAYAKKWNGAYGKNVADRSYIQSALMHKAGNPFKVYDRFYFDPKTREYIPDNMVPQPKKVTPEKR